MELIRRSIEIAKQREKRDNWLFIYWVLKIILWLIYPAIAFMVGGIALNFSSNWGGFAFGLVFFFLIMRIIQTNLSKMKKEGAPPIYEPKETPLGSARLATDEDLISHELYQQRIPEPSNEIFLARIEPPKSHLYSLPYKIEQGKKEFLEMQASKGHLLTVAPSGSGKGTHSVIPNLLGYQGSVVVLDVKGENAAITASQRSKYGKVAFLNPWNVLELGTTKFNPMSIFENSPIENQIDDAGMMASMLVYDSKAGETDHWITSAKALVKAMILYVANNEECKGVRTLQKILSLLCSDKDELESIFTKMAEFEEIEVVQHQGKAMQAKEEKERSSIVSSAIAQLEFLNSHSLTEAMSETSSDFNLKDLKEDVLSLYLIIPPDKIPTYFKWLRLMINTSLVISQRTLKTEKTKNNVLFLLDEFPVLGKIKEISQGMGLLRGYGITLWAIVQDFSQLKALYGDFWQTFISNSYVLQVFGTSDIFTAEYISKMGGQTTQHYMTSNIVEATNWSHTKNTGLTIGQGFNSSSSQGGGSFGQNVSFSNTFSSSETVGGSTSKGQTSHVQSRPLLYIDDILRMGNDDQIIIKRGMPICVEKKIEYWKDNIFKSLADSNPYIDGRASIKKVKETKQKSKNKEESKQTESTCKKEDIKEEKSPRVTLDDVAIKVYKEAKRVFKKYAPILKTKTVFLFKKLVPKVKAKQNSKKDYKSEKNKAETQKENRDFPGAKLYK